MKLTLLLLISISSLATCAPVSGQVNVNKRDYNCVKIDSPLVKRQCISHYAEDGITVITECSEHNIEVTTDPTPTLQRRQCYITKDANGDIIQCCVSNPGGQVASLPITPPSSAGTVLTKRQCWGKIMADGSVVEHCSMNPPQVSNEEMSA